MAFFLGQNAGVRHNPGPPQLTPGLDAFVETRNKQKNSFNSILFPPDMTSPTTVDGPREKINESSIP